jgi:hypothetical protein
MDRNTSVTMAAVIMGMGILTLAILVAIPNQAFAQATSGNGGVGGLGGLPGKGGLAGPGGTNGSNNHGANGSNNHGHSHDR